MAEIRIPDFSAAKNPFINKETRAEIGATDMSRNVKEWYLTNYPEDAENGELIRDLTTFEDIWQGMNEGEDVYEILGYVSDTEILFFVFSRLAMLKDMVIQQLYGLQNDAPRLAWKKMLLDTGISFEKFYMLRKTWDDLCPDDKSELSDEYKEGLI